MSIHQEDLNKEPDELFIKGGYQFLLEGNVCRLLDGRRTPGYIESIDKEAAMFVWRISGYEDSGNSWVLPFKDVFHFQFKKDAKLLDDKTCLDYQSLDESFNEDLYLSATDQARDQSELIIEGLKKDTSEWIKNNDNLQSSIEKFDLEDFEILKSIASEFERYMKEQGLLDLEKRTAQIMVLNPNSGEWIKGMKIVLAEMGLVTCKVKAIRTKDIFTGLGHKENRRAYIYHRLAFLRSLFGALGLNEPILYRGMASEQSWQNVERSLLNMTFSKKVAEEFSSFSDERFKSAYIMRTNVKLSDLFMTYIETQEMNDKYMEREAVVFMREAMYL